MKKVFSALLVTAIVCAVLATLLVGCGNKTDKPDPNAEQTLVVYNWGDYIDEAVEVDFENYYKEKTGKSIDLIYSTFDTNEIMMTTLQKGDEHIDLVCPSEYAIQKLMQEGLISKLDMSKISNLANVESDIYDKVNAVFNGITIKGVEGEQAMSDYFVPYMWGTLGILYNKDVVTEADLAKGYGLLWNAAENKKLEGKILMKDSIRDSYVAGVLYLKETGKLPASYNAMSIEALINTVDEELLKLTEDVFVAQAEHLKGYEVDFGKGQMTSGRAYVDLAWSGDALWAMEDAENLDYFVPEIGGNIWFDGWVMPTSAQNPDAAYAFIEYLCRPDISMRNAMAIGYTSAVDKDVLSADADALAILAENEYTAEEFFSDEIRYPDINANPNLGVMKDFGAMNEPVVAMWERVKSSQQDFMWILWVVIGVVGAAAIGFLVYWFGFKNKKTARRIGGSAPKNARLVKKAEPEEDTESEE